MTPEQRPHRLRLDGALHLPRIEACRDRVMAALQANQAVEIDCRDATDIDLTFVQLLLAARRSAASQGRSLTLAGPAEGALLAALQRGGFLPGPDAPDAAAFGFWRGATSSA